MKTTAPKRYCVRPNAGLIPPHSTYDVEVELILREPLASLQDQKDKFLVQSTIVEEGEDIKTLWDGRKPEQIVQEKLRSFFKSPRTTSAQPASTATTMPASQASAPATTNEPSKKDDMASIGRTPSAEVSEMEREAEKEREREKEREKEKEKTKAAATPQQTEAVPRNESAAGKSVVQTPVRGNAPSKVVSTPVAPAAGGSSVMEEKASEVQLNSLRLENAELKKEMERLQTLLKREEGAQSGARRKAQQALRPGSASTMNDTSGVSMKMVILILILALIFGRFSTGLL